MLARIFQIQGCDECVVVSGSGIFVLAKAGDVARDGVPSRLPSFVHGASVGDAARWSGNDGSIAAFGFRSEQAVVAVACFCHETAVI